MPNINKNDKAVAPRVYCFPLANSSSLSFPPYGAWILCLACPPPLSVSFVLTNKFGQIWHGFNHFLLSSHSSSLLLGVATLPVILYFLSKVVTIMRIISSPHHFSFSLRAAIESLETWWLHRHHKNKQEYFIVWCSAERRPQKYFLTFRALPSTMSYWNKPY